ncbi:MAG: peptide chain release factor N(5)-glutamine methyltransferase [Myxococcales bacterium]|nr:peptide chain release factor N(5)-glutamine methyltransferase [Myxococcales bacterium]
MSDEVWTVMRALKWTVDLFTQKGILSPRLDAELLLRQATGLERIQLYTQHDKPLSAEERDQLRTLVKRRMTGEPVQHILGRQEFWSIPLKVSNAVLVPRADTEVLVEEVVKIAKTITVSGSLRIVDVGVGSGAIALALAKEFPDALVVGIDISPAALEIARTNVETHALRDRVRLIRGNVLTPLLHGGSRADMVVSNPPYIRTAELDTLMPEVRLFEPMTALDGGPDGLTIYRELVPQAAQILVPGGLFAVEIGDTEQCIDVMNLLHADSHYDEIEVRKDYAGRDRVVVARRIADGP